MHIEVKRIPVGMLVANCYIVSSTTDGSAIVIDPGAEGEKIVDAVEQRELKVHYIINTHGHGDHIGANNYVRDHTGAEILMHEADVEMLISHYKGFRRPSGNLEPSHVADRLLTGHETITVGDMSFQVFPTPGHTPGGISLYSEGIVFTGDTLFKGTVGRTDYPWGSHDELIAGIKLHLVTLPDDTVVYPGHGHSTTIGHEKLHNPFLTE